MDVSFDDHVEIVGERLGKDSAYLLDSTKLKTEFNWVDKVTLQQGIQETIGWIDNNLEALKSLPHEYIHKV